MSTTPRRERRAVSGRDELGPYTLLRLARGGLAAGAPGQFFMLEAPGCPLPRPFSLCTASATELGFLVDPIGRGTRALAALEQGDEIAVFGPLGRGFALETEAPLLVGGGIGMAPLPYLSDILGAPPAVLGFRSRWHAEAAVLLPQAEVVVDPVLVTEVLPPGRDLFACGPPAMLEALQERFPGAQLSYEAPMACGYGACYGCVVEREGQLERLCLAGPVLCAS